MEEQETLSSGWKRAVIVTILGGFTVLIWLAARTYSDAPPIPARAVSLAGETIFTRDGVLAGQQVFLKYGLMENGSIKIWQRTTPVKVWVNAILTAQKWRVIPDNLCRLLDLLPLAPPFLLNSLHLILHHVLGETLFESKEASVLAGGVFDAVLTTVQVE